MVPRILAVCLLSLVLPWAGGAHARTLEMRVQRVSTAVATLERVRVRLAWPADAAVGDLQVWAARLDAPGLGARHRNLHWRCPLQRNGRNGWRCAGPLVQGGAPPWQLSVRFDEAGTQAGLSNRASRLELERTTASPDLTRLDLRQVPLAWAQGLLAQAWPQARFTAGALDGRLLLETPAGRPMRVSGPLQLHEAGLETADAGIAAQGLGAQLQLDYRSAPALTEVAVRGQLRGGELLAGNTYVALPESPVALEVDARRRGAQGWEVPRLAWVDGDALQVHGAFAFEPSLALRSMAVDVRSADMRPLRTRYLSGWLGLFGLGEVDLHGAMDLRLEAEGGRLTTADARLHGVDVRDPAERFVFDGLRGDVRYSLGAPVRSELQWDGGKLYGLAFEAARLPFESADGVLRARGDATVPVMGGRMTFRDLAIRPPSGGSGADIRFGLGLDDIDFGRVSQALGLPAFQGRLSGEIPHARYANERVDFDGGLTMQLFDGQVAISSLALERPFGTAPSLGADIALDGLDLLRLTEVMGFGSISGRLDGRIRGLRLVDWTPVAFDARFITDGGRGVRQRISQRAVQNLGSVGGSSFVGSLQGQLIGLFDDFGYRRIGIGCRLVNEVCHMSGLAHSLGGQGAETFTIVEGAGLPRLTVVGYNRRVDWPTLVERLVAVGSGEVKPVVE